MKVINENEKEVNVLHFQGKSKGILKEVIDILLYNVTLDPIENNLSLVSCWTNNEECILYNQLKKFNINLINAIPENYDRTKTWYMPNKIYFYIDCLNKLDADIVMLLDGYDVLFTSTKDIVKKFKESGYRILFNSTYNKYPNEEIEIIEDRKKKLGFFQYFNAGCCIGYREDLIKFYIECLNYINIPNPANSEQKILRTCFANYSNDEEQKFVWIDYERNIFHTMSHTQPILINKDTIKIEIRKAIYRKIIAYQEITNKSLKDILVEIAVPIIKKNRENGWEDDNFMDIFSEFNKNYIYERDISEEIRELLKTY